MSTSVAIVVTPRADTCTARTAWDAESALLSVAFECALTPADNPAAALERRLGVRPVPKRLVLGEMEVLYRDDVCLQSIEIRTTPAAWIRQALEAVPPAAPPVWLAFDVPYDDNGIFSTHVALSFRWDVASNSLALIFGDLVSLTWHRLADTVACGVSQNGTLAELRLSSVTLG
jgi:hypothetical protein